MSSSSPLIPHKQRALILQGGGALGAYEVGVFKAIYDKIIREEGEDSAANLFDIVAGASIGAINATLLINYFLNNKGWKGTPGELEDFWGELTAQTWIGLLLNNAVIENSWDVLRFLSNNYLASFESLRRYLSVQELAYAPFMGSPNLSWTMPRYGNKFLNLLELFSLRYDFSPLKDILKRYINNFPIQTSFDKGDPRLLLVSVDVKDCTTAVTFDSYQKFKPPQVKDMEVRKDNEEVDEDGQWFTEYGDENNKHVVFHKGIDLDQVLASCLFPFALGHTVMKDEISKSLRTFWDGAFLSNTPLRELIQHHKDFWLDYFDEKGLEYDTSGIEKGIDTTIGATSKYQTGKIKTVPALEVFIVNLYPSVEMEGGPPVDDDLINDRMNDIRFHDKTKYDEKVAHMASDYIDMARELLGRMNTARNKIMEQENTNQIKNNLFAELENLLNVDKVLEMPAKTVSRNDEKRTYRKLLKGRFDVKVCRIDREDDKNTISGKHSDFSTLSIKSLMEKGKEDAIKSFQNCRL
jgi:NTE family protein